jgi:hypothetical protein
MAPENLLMPRIREAVLVQNPGRLAIHYLPDTLHYRDVDLQTWLPAISSLGMNWLILEAEIERAIPESFITGLVNARIRPVLRFRQMTEQPPCPADLRLLLDVYARWGVREAVFFDRPNDRSAWPAASWAQQDLVERFLDRFIPIAETALNAGITPIFPPLQPGGSYWDTAFLRTALQSMMRRKQEKLIRSMALSAYAWTTGKDLDWGAGGPQSWPEAKPYHTPKDSQDHRGFRIFEWYEAITRSVIHAPLPIFLFQAGYPARNNQETDANQQEEWTENILPIARMLVGDEGGGDAETGKAQSHLPAEVVCAAFWLLAAPDEKPAATSAWFNLDGTPRQQAEALSAWRARAKAAQLGASRIKHYLLLPTYEWGVDEVHLEAIRPFLRKYRPTIGFSAEEAVLADSVTVIGDELAYSEDTLNRLRQAGCRVERIQGDGTTIASLLAER